MTNNQQLFQDVTKEVKENDKEYMQQLIQERDGKMLTTEKYYITELTMKECSDEYKALTNKIREVSVLHVSLPQESSLKQQYQDLFDELKDKHIQIAKEIANRLDIEMQY